MSELKKPKCEMNYIGSKYKLLDFIYDTIIEEVGETKLQNSTFCDIFSGTGIVARFFKDKVQKVIANDLEFYSYVFLKAYLSNDLDLDKINKKLKKMNDLSPVKGNFFNFYSENGKAKRLYFSADNGKKLDAIRLELEKNKKRDSEYFYLLTSLIEASDKVANTASVYGAFLKSIKKTARKNLILQALDYVKIENQNNDVYQDNANELIKKISGDILYLDPPYNHREYGANYHVLTTIAKNDFTEFVPKGVTGLRPYTRSSYTKKAEVKKAFEELIKNAKFKYIFMSYNNEGILTLEEIKEIMEKYGKYSVKTKQYGRFKADSKRENQASHVFEYLHILKKH